MGKGNGEEKAAVEVQSQGKGVPTLEQGTSSGGRAGLHLVRTCW